jgi:uncharacterized protein
MKKPLYIVIGSILVTLGTIGIFIPLLPTTIFLILASYFFMKGSPELNERLLNNKYLGHYIKNYRDNKGMPLKSKIISIVMLWISILISGYFLTESNVLRGILLVVAIGVTIYISSLKNIQTTVD